jgi:hypothetical protein
MAYSDRAPVDVEVKIFGQHKGGSLRDGALLSIEPRPASGFPGAWSCNTDAVSAVSTPSRK